MFRRSGIQAARVYVSYCRLRFVRRPFTLCYVLCVMRNCNCQLVLCRCMLLYVGGWVYRGSFTFSAYNAWGRWLFGIVVLCVCGSCALWQRAPRLLPLPATCPFGENSNVTAATTAAAAAAAAIATSATASSNRRFPPPLRG